MTLSLMKNVEEFDSLKFPAVPHLKISPHSESEWMSREYKNWSKTFADQNDRTDDIIIHYVCSSFRVCKSKERLLNICKFVAYFLYFDSTLEPIFIRKSEEDFKILLKKLENVVESGQCDIDFTLGERLRQSLESINKDLTPAQRKVVINALEEHIKYEGYINCYRGMNDRIIPYDVYYRLRREESGLRILYPLMEYGLEFEMTEEIRNDDHMKSFLNNIIDCFISLSDVFTFKFKLVRNHITNHIISYAFFKKNCTLQEAIDYHYKYIAYSEHQFRIYENKIRENQDLFFPELDHYLKGCFDTAYAIIGCYYDLRGYKVVDGFLHNDNWEQLYQTLLDKKARELSFNSNSI